MVIAAERATKANKIFLFFIMISLIVCSLMRDDDNCKLVTVGCKYSILSAIFSVWMNKGISDWRGSSYSTSMLS
jgi:hypothetical protein